MPINRQMMLLLIIVACSALPIYCQHSLKSSITCFTKYDHEETRSQTSNQLLSYSYHEAEITNTATFDGNLCSKIGCACFSYRTICSYNSLERNHYSQCTDDDKRNQAIKWHRGWSSHAECDQMRQKPQIYQDLTCCYTDKCNDQPGLVQKLIDPIQNPIQSNMASNYQGSHYGTYVQPTPRPNPMIVPYQSVRQQYQTSKHNVYQTQSTTPITYSTRLNSHLPTKSYADYKRYHQANRAFEIRLYSIWLIIFSGVLSFFLII